MIKEAVRMYHRISADENFETAAQQVFEVVRQAAEESPGAERHLFLDIDGHRNKNGGFDRDMYEFQVHFLTGFLMKYLTEASTPLARQRNKRRQEEDIPDELSIFDPQLGYQL